MSDSSLQAMRAKVARAHRSKDAQRIQTSTRDLAAAKIEDYVARVVAEAPQLTPDQLASIAVLLRPAGGER